MSENSIGEVARKLERKARKFLQGRAKTRKKIGYDLSSMKKWERKELGKVETKIRRYNALMKRKRLAWEKKERLKVQTKIRKHKALMKRKRSTRRRKHK